MSRKFVKKCFSCLQDDDLDLESFGKKKKKKKRGGDVLEEDDNKENGKWF